MKRLFHLNLIFCCFLFFLIAPVEANTEFEKYLNDFYLKQAQASRILSEIELDLKDGSRVKVCSRQREAAQFGIEAIESLIKAFELSGSKSQTKELHAGINKWKELMDYC